MTQVDRKLRQQGHREGQAVRPQTIEVLPVRRLRPYPGNARTHSKKQIRQIAESIDASASPTRC